MTDLTTINVTLDRLKSKKQDLSVLSSVVMNLRNPPKKGPLFQTTTSLGSGSGHIYVKPTLLSKLVPQEEILANALELIKKTEEEVEKIEQVFTALSYALTPLMDKSE